MSPDPTFVARPYQREGVAHLLRRPFGGLLQEPGTGKTAEVLAAFHILKKKRLVDRLLVVAPLRPCYSVWPAEIRKWGFDFTHVVLHGSKKNVAIEETADVLIVNYDGLRWLSQRWAKLKTDKIRTWLVLDESTKVKNPSTQRSKTLKALLPCFVRRTILTGTPAPNGLMDLFGQVLAVDGGEALGQYITQYRRAYFYPTGYGGYSWIPQEDAEKRIYQRLDGLFYRVDDSVLSLPPIHRNRIEVDLPDAARVLYKRLEAEFIAELEGVTLTAANAGVLTSKLRQIANGFLYDADGKTHVVHDAKIEALIDLVEELSGNPVLVGYEFTADAERIQAALKKAGVPTAPIIGGGTTAKAADVVFTEFNAGKHPVLLCQSDAVAHGLNLQDACHTVARFGLTWNLETFIQFRKRVHRSGQRKTVIDHHILAHGTIDGVIWQALERKNAVQSDLLKALKARYGK